MSRRFELRREVVLPASPDEVWRAIATPEGQAGWFMISPDDPDAETVDRSVEEVDTGEGGDRELRIDPAPMRCASRSELDRLWTGLAESGQPLMPLDDYGFGPFGWTNDRFGVSWQLSLA